MIAGPGAAGWAHACDTFDDYLFRIARRYFEAPAEEHRSAPKSNARRKNPYGMERGPSKEQAA